MLWKLWYPLLTGLTRRTPLTFLNYGYSEASPAAGRPNLAPADEVNRPCIQLYNAVVRPVDLSNLRVLEVSSGHGGGASYIARYFNPASMHGVDRNGRAIALCRRVHNAANLSFSRGDAMALPFPDGSFDAVVNVEASHCYPDMPRFLTEAARVLRPGGHLLYADFRTKDPDSATLHQQLERSGLRIIDREDISAHVVRGMKLNTVKYLQQIRDVLPAFLRKPAMRFAGVEGSAIFEELKSGKTVYLRYLLQK